MDEKEQKEAEEKAAEEVEAAKAASGTDDAKDRDKPKEQDQEKSPSMIDGAILAAEALKKENDRKEDLLDREEKLQSQMILGGKGFAGQSPKKEMSEEDVKKAKAAEFFKDTALGDAIAQTK
ncbi:MAG TPA: hypothetical protein ENI23_08060 [bacterium]|nr:hypothetical protein [bacterium]